MDSGCNTLEIVKRKCLQSLALNIHQNTKGNHFSRKSILLCGREKKGRDLLF